MPEPKILLSGLGMPESPRWHEGRLWFCNWIDRQVVAVSLDGTAEVMLTRDPASHPMGYSIDWLPDGRLLTTGAKLERQERAWPPRAGRLMSSRARHGRNRLGAGSHARRSPRRASPRARHRSAARARAARAPRPAGAISVACLVLARQGSGTRERYRASVPQAGQPCPRGGLVERKHGQEYPGQHRRREQQPPGARPASTSLARYGAAAPVAGEQAGQPPHVGEHWTAIHRTRGRTRPCARTATARGRGR